MRITVQFQHLLSSIIQHLFICNSNPFFRNQYGFLASRSNWKVLSVYTDAQKISFDFVDSSRMIWED